MMKKVKALLLALALCLVASQVLAGSFPIEKGDWAKYRSGNPATLTVDKIKYDAFCIQHDILIADGVWYKVRSVGKAPLSDESKWLYAAYHEGKFDEMDYSSMADVYSHDYSLGYLVQLGIWYSEGDSEGAWSLEKSLMKPAWDLFAEYLPTNFKWETSTYSKYWDVYSIDLDAGQNQIVGVQTGEPPSEVPEPATMALFGFGLMGLAGAARRRKTA